MSDVKFKPGDTVCLKSGGPLMTVEKTGKRGTINDEAVWCVWFDGKKNCNKTFPPETLKHSVSETT